MQQVRFSKSIFGKRENVCFRHQWQAATSTTNVIEYLPFVYLTLIQESRNCVWIHSKTLRFLTGVWEALPLCINGVGSWLTPAILSNIKEQSSSYRHNENWFLSVYRKTGKRVFQHACNTMWEVAREQMRSLILCVEAVYLYSLTTFYIRDKKSILIV